MHVLVNTIGVIINYKFEKLRQKIWNFLPYRIAAIILGILLGLFLLAVFIINPFLNWVAKPKIEDAVNKSNKSHLIIENLNYSFFGNSLSADNITYSWIDSAKTSTDSSEIFVPFTKLNGIPLFSLIFGGEKTISSIEIDNPKYEIIKFKKEKLSKNTTSEKKGETKFSVDSLYKIVWRILPEKAKPFEIGSIRINEGSYLKRNSGDERNITDSIKNINIFIDNLSLQSSPQKDSLDLMFFSSLNVDLKNISLLFPNSGYHLTTNSLRISSKDSLIEVDSFSLVPESTLENFFALRKFRSDRWEVKINSFKCSGFNFKNLAWDKFLNINQIDLDAESIDILSNIRLPPDPSASPKMPNEIVQELGFDLNIKSLNVNLDSMLVKSLFPYHDEPSVLIFTNNNAAITNISNIKEIQSIEKPCIINVSGLIAGTSKVDLEMRLPLLTKKLTFFYKGTMSSMDATNLNPHLVVSDLIRVTSGGVGSAEYSVDFKNDSGHVYVRPIYSNLSIEKVDDETFTESGAMEKLSSFIANTFKLRKNNPNEDGEVKVARVVYPIKPKDVFLDAVWGSLKTGLGEVIGF